MEFLINFISPFGIPQFKTLLERIAVGGKIIVSDSVGNPVKIYKDKDGLAAWSSPIYMDSLGHAPLAIWLPWQVSYDFFFYDKEGNLIQAYYGISGVGDFTQGGANSLASIREWIPTSEVIRTGLGFVDIIGDFTQKIKKYNRLRLSTNQDYYGWAVDVTLISPSPDPVTRITFDLDRGLVLIGRINSVRYGVISSQDTSYPMFLGGSVYYKRGQDFIVAPIMSIWTVDGNFHEISGVGEISSFGSESDTQPGATKYLFFKEDAVITYTRNVIPPILTPRDEDLRVFAGDIVQVILNEDGQAIAFPLLSNTADISLQAPPIQRNVVVSGDADSNGKPNIIKIPILKDVVPVMDSNTSPSGYLATASTAFDASSQPFHAFDSNETTVSWSTALYASANSWLAILIPGEKRVRAYSITRRADSDQGYPATWYLQGSNDGSSWTNLDYQENQIGWPLGGTRTFYLQTYPLPYTNFRIFIIAISGASSLAQIANLALYEFENDADFLVDGEESITPTFGTESTVITVVDSSPPNMTSNILPSPYVASANRSYDSGGENLLLWSEDLLNPIWSAYKCLVSSTIEVAPNGLPAFMIRTMDTTTLGGYDRPVLGQPFTLKAGGTYNLSAYVKLISGSDYQGFCCNTDVPTQADTGCNRFFNIVGYSNSGGNSTNFSIGESSSSVLGDGWFRVNWDFTYDGLVDLLRNYIGFGPYYNNLANEILISGIQLTEGVNVKPYTKTTNSQAIPVGPSQADPYLAFDGYTNTGWYPDKIFIMGDWLSIDMGSAITISDYDISSVVDPDNGLNAPKDFIIQGSNDDLNWEDIDSQVNVSWANGESTKNFLLSSVSSPYRYFRLYLVSSTGVP